MVGSIVADAWFVRLFAQYRSQASPDHLIEFEEDARMGMLEVAEPASERPVEITDDDPQAFPASSSRFLADRLLELVEALLAHMTTAAFEPVAEELKPIPLLPAIGDPCLRRMQREAIRRRPRPNQRECRQGLDVPPGEGDEVVRISHHRIS